MKLRIRYENELQILELNAEDTEKLWVSLSLEGEGLSQDEKERLIQDTWEERFNKPEYNIWHKETRHIDPTPKRKKMNGKVGYIQAEPDDESFNIMDYLLVAEDDHSDLEYQETCKWIRSVCGKKQNWADAFIAVKLDKIPVNTYAASIGVTDVSIVYKYLARAKKILKENYTERQI